MLNAEADAPTPTDVEVETATMAVLSEIDVMMTTARDVRDAVIARLGVSIIFKRHRDIIKSITQTFMQDKVDDDVKENVELSHLDQVLMSMKPRRRRRLSDQMMADEAETAVPDLLARMEVAAKKDELALAHQTPATHKMALLDEVERMGRRSKLHEALLDQGLLCQIRAWLSLLPKGALPNVTLRSRLYTLLELLPIDQDYLLESDGLGKAIMALWKHPGETVKCKSQLRALIEAWSRPLYNADTDYRKIHEWNQQRHGTIQKRVKKMKAESDHSLIHYQSRHAARPDKAIFDYSVQPVSALPTESEKTTVATPERHDRIKRTIERLSSSQSKSSRALSVNLKRATR